MLKGVGSPLSFGKHRLLGNLPREPDPRNKAADSTDCPSCSGLGIACHGLSLGRTQ